MNTIVNYKEIKNNTEKHLKTILKDGMISVDEIEETHRRFQKLKEWERMEMVEL